MLSTNIAAFEWNPIFVFIMSTSKVMIQNRSPHICIHMWGFISPPQRSSLKENMCPYFGQKMCDLYNWKCALYINFSRKYALKRRALSLCKTITLIFRSSLLCALQNNFPEMCPESKTEQFFVCKIFLRFVPSKK